MNLLHSLSKLLGDVAFKRLAAGPSKPTTSGYNFAKNGADANSNIIPWMADPTMGISHASPMLQPVDGPRVNTKGYSNAAFAQPAQIYPTLQRIRI